jgi:hypothetical protein
MTKNRQDPGIHPLAGERFDNESDRAVKACNDYLRMPLRSLRGLASRYHAILEAESRENVAKCSKTEQQTASDALPDEQTEHAEAVSEGGGEPDGVRGYEGCNVATRSGRTLFDWSSRFDWAGRTALYDLKAEEKKDEAHEAAMLTGIATPYNRIGDIKEDYANLLDAFYKRDKYGRHENMYIRQPKTIIVKGQDGEPQSATAWVPTFNSAGYSAIQALREEAAKETGGRQLKEQAVPRQSEEDEHDLSVLSDEELDTYAAILKKCRTQKPAAP